MQSETLVVDGAVPLALRVYVPRTGPARASVVIGGAMGVRQAFYGPFAAWLAQQGLRVTTFDYRGQGESLNGGMREVRANLFDWARDYDAVIAHAAQALPGQPLLLLGHSLGAQLPGLLREHARVSGLLSVAAGSGYWRDNAPRIRRAMPAFWHVLVPLSVRLCGYFPAAHARRGRPARGGDAAVAPLVPAPALQRGGGGRIRPAQLRGGALSGTRLVHAGR